MLKIAFQKQFIVEIQERSHWCSSSCDAVLSLTQYRCLGYFFQLLAFSLMASNFIQFGHDALHIRENLLYIESPISEGCLGLHPASWTCGVEYWRWQCFCGACAKASAWTHGWRATMVGTADSEMSNTDAHRKARDSSHRSRMTPRGSAPKSAKAGTINKKWRTPS